MTIKPLRLLAYSSAVAIALCIGGKEDAIAQVTQSITATLKTSSAITVAKVSDMDFGEWLVRFVDNTPSITLTDDGTASTSQTGTLGNSIVVEIVDGASEGVVTASIPAAATLQLSRGAITNFLATGISLNTITYDTDHGTTATLAANTPVNFVVSAANTPEQVNLGGVINITGNPTDGTHTASFVLTFQY